MPPDRFYLFPPVPWEETVRGVVHLTSSSAPATAGKPATALAQSEVPPIRPTNIEALRRRYAPIFSEQQVNDYQAVYGADEKRAAGKQTELIKLMGTLKTAAKDVTDQPELQRYLLLRSFVAARDAGATVATLNEIAELIRPTLRQSIPSVLVQRAELDGALADASLEAKRNGQEVAAMQSHIARAAEAFYDVAHWQEQHYYLSAAPEMIERAEYYAHAGKVENILRVCGKLRMLVEDWSRLRDQFMEKYHAVRTAPEDSKANAEYARIMIVVCQNVPSMAHEPLIKSGDPALMALGEAAATRDPVARNGAVGLALLPIIDAADGKEKSILVQIAVQHLDQFGRSGRTSDPNFTKARLHLTRLKALLPTAPSEVAANDGNGAAGGGDAGDNPVFVPTTARRVVYVLDGSGSMMSKFDLLRKAVTKAVDDLKPNQFFNVVIMHEDEGAPFTKQALAATDANKKLFNIFLRKSQPHGSSDPVPALRFAFSQNPEVVYFLTDGDFPNNNQVIAEIRKLNSAHRTKIHTIAFVERGEEYEKVLRLISDQSGGTFRSVTDADTAKLK
jgi:hypothetical protein